MHVSLSAARACYASCEGSKLVACGVEITQWSQFESGVIGEGGARRDGRAIPRAVPRQVRAA